MVLSFLNRIFTAIKAADNRSSIILAKTVGRFEARILSAIPFISARKTHRNLERRIKYLEARNAALLEQLQKIAGEGYQAGKPPGEVQGPQLPYKRTVRVTYQGQRVNDEPFGPETFTMSKSDYYRKRDNLEQVAAEMFNLSETPPTADTHIDILDVEFL